MKNIPQIIRNIFYYKIFDKYKKVKGAFNTRGKTASFDDLYQTSLKDRPAVVIDVGAYNGKSIARYKQALNLTSIHSFEPSAENYKLISADYEQDPIVTLNKKALGRENATLVLNYNHKPDTSSILPVDENHAWTQRRAKEMGVAPEQFIAKTEEVEVIPLDDYIQAQALKNVDILKIDTQGFELEVLSGAQDSIRNGVFKFIEIEVILHGVYKGVSKNLSDVEALLLPHNYKLIATSNALNILHDQSLSFDCVYVRQDIFDALSES